MNQNQKGVLMCYNIPRGIKEENLYELFCIAGPIESIQSGKSGKSVFILYEFREAVATAKEIFKDVKLYGRPIRMFDKDDIENIHAKQEEEQNLKEQEINYDHDGPHAKFRRYEEFPRRAGNSQNYHCLKGSRYHENYSSESNYQEFNQFRGESPHSQEIYSRNKNHFQASESTVVHFEQTTSRNNFICRSDLPNNQKQDTSYNDFNYSSDRRPNNLQNRREEFRRSDDTLINFDNFRNPYEEQVSRHNQRNSRHYQDYRSRKRDKPYDRSSQRNYHESNFSKNPYRNRQRHQNFQ